MINLEMENINERIPLKKYFYDEKSSLFFWVCVILSIPTVGGAFLVYLIVKLLINSSGDEMRYDRILQQDIMYLRDRAVNVMGLIPEELSLIEPIVTYGYAGDDTVEKTAESETEKKDLFQKIVTLMTSLPKKILSFFRRLFSGKDTISHSVFFEGRDEKIRSSLISVHIISFTEQQIVAYTCNYDIALGLILKEYVREIYYRDVETVSYGNKIRHMYLNNGKLLRMSSSWASVTVSSVENIVASMAGNNDLLEDQVTAMKNLIRSKKEEMA